MACARWTTGLLILLVWTSDVHAEESPLRIYGYSQTIWLKRMLSGDAEPPEFFASQEEMLKWVSTTPGAVEFVDLAIVNDVRVIAVTEEE